MLIIKTVDRKPEREAESLIDSISAAKREKLDLSRRNVDFKK